MTSAPRFRRDPEHERRMLWGLVGIVVIVSLGGAMLVYFLGTQPRAPRVEVAKPARAPS
jgi:hypothetical protein